jgi:hypothetical protein
MHYRMQIGLLTTPMIVDQDISMKVLAFHFALILYVVLISNFVWAMPDATANPSSPHTVAFTATQHR